MGVHRVPRERSIKAKRPAGRRPSTHLVPPCLRHPSSPVSPPSGWGGVKKEAREKTKLELSYPKAQCPAISPGLCLGPHPRTWSCSLRSAPRAWDEILGTPALSARGRLWVRQLAGVLRAAGRGSGKLAARERDEGEDEEGEARPPASWSPLRAPGLEGRRRSRSWREDAGASGTAMRLCSGSAPAAGGAASPPISHGDGSRSWGPAWTALSLSSRIGILRFGTAGPARSRPHHPMRRAAN